MPSKFQDFEEDYSYLEEENSVDVCNISSISYDSWEDEDIDIRMERELLESLDEKYDELSWPTKWIMYPSVKFMVQHNAPPAKPPAPLLKRQIQSMEEYKKGHEELCSQEKIMKKKVVQAEEALRAEETKPKVYGQKWSDRINGGPSNAVKHLKMEYDRATQAHSKVKQDIEKFEKTYSTIVQLIQAHNACTRAYEKCRMEEEKLDKAMWGY